MCDRVARYGSKTYKSINIECSTESPTQLKNCIEAQQFNREMLEEIFDIAETCEKIKPGTPESKQLDGYIMATLFYEPSTRTRLSFESAMRRLGGSVLTTESAAEFSSAAKGETLEGKPKHALNATLNSEVVHRAITHIYHTHSHWWDHQYHAIPYRCLHLNQGHTCDCAAGGPCPASPDATMHCSCLSLKQFLCDI